MVNAHAGGYISSDLALGTLARKIYLCRRERDKSSQVPGLFQDPAWDILLDLFASHAEKKQITITSAALAANVPPTSGLRWLWALENANLVERRADLFDKRRKYAFLTPKGLIYMRKTIFRISDRLGMPHHIENHITESLNTK